MGAAAVSGCGSGPVNELQTAAKADKGSSVGQSCSRRSRRCWTYLRVGSAGGSGAGFGAGLCLCVGLRAAMDNAVLGQHGFGRKADTVSQAAIEWSEIGIHRRAEKLVVGADDEIRLLEIVDPVLRAHHAL